MVIQKDFIQEVNFWNECEIRLTKLYRQVLITSLPHSRTMCLVHVQLSLPARIDSDSGTLIKPGLQYFAGR